MLRRRLQRGDVARDEVEAHLVQVERQLDAAVTATEDVKRAVEPTA